MAVTGDPSLNLIFFFNVILQRLPSVSIWKWSASSFCHTPSPSRRINGSKIREEIILSASLAAYTGFVTPCISATATYNVCFLSASFRILPAFPSRTMASPESSANTPWNTGVFLPARNTPIRSSRAAAVTAAPLIFLLLNIFITCLSFSSALSSFHHRQNVS